MYEIHFRRNFDTPRDYVRGGTRMYSNLREARAARQVSGDLVIDTYTMRVVADESWLWEWERLDPSCYARRAIAHDNPK